MFVLKYFVFAQLFLLFISCSIGGDRLNDIAFSIETHFKSISASNLSNADKIALLYGTAAEGVRISDLELSLMDKSNGGVYEELDAGSYYKSVDDGNGVFYLSGYHPVNRDLKRLIKTLEPMSQILKGAKEKFGDSVTYITFWDQNSFTFQYPYRNVLGMVSPRLDFTKAAFYKFADKINNPERKTLWIPEPIVDLGGAGWIMTCASPVYTGGELRGIAFSNVSISFIQKKYFDKNDMKMLLFTNGMLPVAATEACVNEFDLKLLDSYNYMAKLKQNPKASDEYRLDDINQSADVLRMAGFLKKAVADGVNTSFNITLHNREHKVVYVKINGINLNIAAVM